MRRWGSLVNQKLLQRQKHLFCTQMQSRLHSFSFPSRQKTKSDVINVCVYYCIQYVRQVCLNFRKVWTGIKRLPDFFFWGSSCCCLLLFFLWRSDRSHEGRTGAKKETYLELQTRETDCLTKYFVSRKKVFLRVILWSVPYYLGNWVGFNRRTSVRGWM